MKLRKIQSERKCKCIHLARLVYETKDGREKTAPVWSHKPIEKPEDLDGYVSGVMVVVRDKEGRVLVTREFRLAVNRFVWGFPAGMINRGESPADAAVREVFEETGLKVKAVKVHDPAYINPAASNEMLQMVECVLDEDSQITGSNSVFEEIESQWISLLNINSFLVSAGQNISVTARERLMAIAL